MTGHRAAILFNPDLLLCEEFLRLLRICIICKILMSNGRKTIIL